MPVLLFASFSNFLSNFAAADVDICKLRNALKILSETEKQIKTRKNQSTWLTAALLHFNMREPYCLEF
jgi:hypothetical protein